MCGYYWHAMMSIPCRTRGIDDATARQVLVYSFGSEVTQHFKYDLLIKRIQENVNATIAAGILCLDCHLAEE